MGPVMKALDVLSLIVAAAIAGIILNSTNTVGVINGIANLFTGTLYAATSTIR